MSSVSLHPDHASPDCRVTKGRGREASQNLAKVLVEAQSRAGFPLWPLQGGRLWNTADCSGPLLLAPHGTEQYKYRESHRSCLSLEVHLFSFKVFFKCYLNFCGLETKPYVSVGILCFLLAKKYHSTRTGSGADSLPYKYWCMHSGCCWTSPSAVSLLEVTHENCIPRDPYYTHFFQGASDWIDSALLL